MVNIKINIESIASEHEKALLKKTRELQKLIDKMNGKEVEEDNLKQVSTVLTKEEIDLYKPKPHSEKVESDDKKEKNKSNK